MKKLFAKADFLKCPRAYYLHNVYKNPDTERKITLVNPALSLARRAKDARERRAYGCPRGPAGCFACQPYEAILRGDAEYVGVGGYGQDMYLV